MFFKDEVRANEFDEWVGEIQTLKALDLGVGESILDIGCGIGQFTPLFLWKFKRVVGLDPSEEYLKVARETGGRVEYVQGLGEAFEGKFDTINMTNLLEHVNNPVLLLENCKRNLNPGGRIIAQVPNANSITRRLGVLMEIIDSIENISSTERDKYGHQRVYTLDSLVRDAEAASLKVVEKGGILYKPFPNEMLLKICKEKGKEWTKKFLKALVEFGKDRPEDCAQLYISCVLP